MILGLDGGEARGARDEFGFGRDGLRVLEALDPRRDFGLVRGDGRVLESLRARLRPSRVLVGLGARGHNRFGSPRRPSRAKAISERRPIVPIGRDVATARERARARTLSLSLSLSLSRTRGGCPQRQNRF